MFGLMRSRACSLTKEQKYHRRLHYCGVCKTLGGLYGQKTRFLLNYDAVFLAELLTALSGADDGLKEWDRAYQSYNCLSLPDAHQEMPPALQLAATATVILTEFKVGDHLKDSGGFRWQAARRFFSKNFRDASTRLRQWGFPLDEMRRCLLTQEKREAEVAAAFSSPEERIACLAEPTARATALFFEYGARMVGSQHERVMYALGHTFGTLVCLMDAYEDYEKDCRKGEFNALRAAYGIEANRLSTEHRRRVQQHLWALEAKIAGLLHQLPISPARAAMFAERLESNLSSKLGADLPVVGHACNRASRLTFGRRRQLALSLGKEVANRHREAKSSPLVARLQSPFVFASVLPVAFFFPRHVMSAGSYRECVSVGCNLIFLGSAFAMLLTSFRSLLPVGAQAPAPDGKRKKREGGCDCCECDCCCEGCCEGCHCCGDCHCCGCDCN